MTEPGRLDRSADGLIFFDRQMRTASFVVFEIVPHDPAQPGRMENNDMIQALPVVRKNSTRPVLRPGNKCYKPLR